MEFPRKEAPDLKENILNFQIVDWYVPESDRNRDKTEEPELYTMIIYGITQEGYTVCTNIIGYEPHFYVKPPESWDKYSDCAYISKVAELQSIISSQDKTLGYYKCVFKNNNRETVYNKKIIPNHLAEHFNGLSMIKKKEFWGFTNNKDFRYIKITVKSLALYNCLKYYFQSLKKEGYKLYESNIDPFLRYIHEQNIKPCGWVSVENFDFNEENDTRCDYNIETEHTNVKPIQINNIAPLMIASFDIECMSNSGDFPVSKKDYRKTAQDLSNIAKAGYEITEEFIMYWLETIYSCDAIVDDNLKVNRVYPKISITSQIFNEIYVPKLKEHIPKIINILDKISNIYIDVSDNENEEEDLPKQITIKECNILETELKDILTSILPQLKGDKIIQIGTTVHKYGSDEIIYKNIISLNTCDKIKDTDVITCKTEKELLLYWKDLIVRLNPDILTGYNIFGFDMEYIWTRAVENNIIDKFSTGIGRKITRKCTLIKQELTSSALGENILKYFDMDGTIIIDLFKVMQREHKLDSYKLDNVAKIFIGDQKDDLKPHEIFEKFKGTSEDRCIIAKYCIQDCALVNRLIHKMKIIENNIGMGNVCLVPLNYLFKRGQGIKIFSLIAKECMDKGYLIPVIRNFDTIIEYDKDGYEGAVVLDPKEGIYLNDPIVVFDYGSLYPSSMIARNLSHDCYVIDKKYQVEDPNIDYMTVSYDLYEGVGEKKKKVGVKECVFAQYKDGRKGIISDILCMLLRERKNTRKKMEYKTITTIEGSKISGILTDKDNEYDIYDLDTDKSYKISKDIILNISDTFNNFEQDVFDALQLAYKITANSLYGQIGAKTSPIYLKEIAACTTATGREMIMLAKDFVEKNYNAEVIYGDSVMPYTPITYKTKNQIYISTFENIEGCWYPYNNFKLHDKNRTHKEQYQPNDIYVWTHNGWSKVRRIIRHKTTKKIYRITTSTSVVDITEDHSLLNPDVSIVKPNECYIGKELLQSWAQLEPVEYYFSKEQAYIYGHFIANGKCKICYTDNGKEYIWEIENTNIDYLIRCKEYLEKNEKLSFVINKRNNIYILHVDKKYDKNIDVFIQKYINACYHKQNKIVPQVILNSSNTILLSFKDGLDDGISYNYLKNNYILDIKQQITIQSYIVLFRLLGYYTSLKNVINNKICIILETSNNNDNSIKDIKILHNSYYGYVYDIETEEGVFHGGIGNMILKNTDSIFCKFPLKDDEGNRIYGKESLKYAIEIGKHVEKNIVSIMPNPQKLNYEKSLYPFIIFSKKRYVGNLYENDITKFKQKSMGIVLKRRDNAPIVKKIYGGIIDILLNRQDLHESIKYLQEELNDLVNGRIPLTDLIITKSLRASYKDPTKIAHKVLADRMGERDPGNKPQANDRIPYIYIKVDNVKLQGDRIENPDYIKDKNLIPDYLHYITNQIMKPVLQLYSLSLNELPNYNKTDDYWNKIEEELKLKPIYQDDIKRKNRIDNLKLKMVKELLFDEFINILEPKVAKVSKIAKVSRDVKSSVKKNEEIKISISNDDTNILQADIKVIKKKNSNKIESNAKIIQNKKSIWIYKNEEASDKTKEYIKIIMNMIEYIKDKNIKLNITINNKQFIKDYKSSLIKYKELEEQEKLNECYIENAIKTNDIGIMKELPTIIKFENMIKSRTKFELL